VLLQEFGSPNVHSDLVSIFLYQSFLVVILAGQRVYCSIDWSARLPAFVFILPYNNFDLDSVTKKVNWQIFLLAGLNSFSYA